LRAVDHPKLRHLDECLVFAGTGRNAAPNLSSGGDLDGEYFTATSSPSLDTSTGDTFFVCWDKDLIPSSIHEVRSITCLHLQFSYIFTVLYLSGNKITRHPDCHSARSC
jgi:hypothetical protein